MTIYNLGSINADYFYSVPHLPGPGETIAAFDQRIGLGGKGANQSVAAAKAGAHVVHIGTIGPDGDWTVTRMREYGVDTAHIATVNTPTAHAIINVDVAGENAIVIFPGANQHQSDQRIKDAMQGAGPGDYLVLQNETSHQVEAAQIAKAQGMTIVYSAAPFDAEKVAAVLPFVDILILNEVEEKQLRQSIGAVDVASMLVTKGARGADWHSDGKTVSISAQKVDPVDATGAGDTFAGYVVAGLSEGMTPKNAMELAANAAALKVTRHGTADAIPTRDEVLTFASSL